MKEEEFNNRYCFHIHIQTRSYNLCADTRMEMEEWMRDLRNATGTSISKALAPEDTGKIATGEREKGEAR